MTLYRAFHDFMSYLQEEIHVWENEGDSTILNGYRSTGSGNEDEMNMRNTFTLYALAFTDVADVQNIRYQYFRRRLIGNRGGSPQSWPRWSPNFSFLHFHCVDIHGRSCLCGHYMNGWPRQSLSCYVSCETEIMCTEAKGGHFEH
jgi:hypothetical protein